ncbi:MAG: hypothetical protein QOI12_166 [Alphaproteobacteria bacterium]|jgi:hypothetical protein|nr:hypothetical protein [Alphaproteobacteria bacterium]
MDQKLVRIRELINQKEAIDSELASLIGGTNAKPKRGRPRKAAANGQSSRENSTHGESASKDVA